MSDILARICADKHRHVAAAKRSGSLDSLDAVARTQEKPRGFAKALSAKLAAGQYGLIAEIKKASPSAGLIRPDFHPPVLAGAYHRAGAACLSVLTDAPYFQGDDEYVAQVRAAAPLPVLRKDFMVDPWQILESRALGADCVLIIMAALSDAQAAEMEAAAFALGMDVLVEVHDEAEFDRALALKSNLIGVNNRNLKTMTTDIGTTERLAARLPRNGVSDDSRMLVAESGLRTPADLARMAACGARCFLIGESLMRTGDLETATRALLADPA